MNNVTQFAGMAGIFLLVIAILGGIIKLLKVINDKYGALASIAVVGLMFLGVALLFKT